MNLRRGREDRMEINLIPLIDILFILLIFFIVTTSFKQEIALNIELPQAGGVAPQDSVAETLVLSIDKKGQYFINDRVVGKPGGAGLQDALQQAVGVNKDIPLIVSADGQTPHQAVITAMDAARQLGLVRLTFAAREADNPP